MVEAKKNGAEANAATKSEEGIRGGGGIPRRRHRKYTELDVTEAARTMIPSIQLSLRSLRLTSHLASCPVAWMTSKLQKPSHSWKTGADHRRNLSHKPIVADSSSPPRPNIQA